MEIIRIIHQRVEYILNQNFSKVATTRGWSKWKILHQYVFNISFPACSTSTTHIHISINANVCW